MKKFIIMHHLFPNYLENASNSLCRVLTLTTNTYTEALTKEEALMTFTMTTYIRSSL